MALRLACLLAAVVCVAHGAGHGQAKFMQSFHNGLTQNVVVACKLGVNMNFTMTVFIDVGTDFIGNIYMVNQTDMSHTTHKTYDLVNTMRVSGNGTETYPYYISVEAYMNEAGMYSVTPESEAMLAEFKDGILSLQVMVKSNTTLDVRDYNPYVLFPDDVLYMASCNKSETEDYYVSTGLVNATGNVEETALEVMNKLTMEVRIEDDSIWPPTFVKTTNIKMGDKIELHVLNDPTSKNYELVSGTYVHSLKVCDAKDCKGSMTYTLLDKYGCPTTFVPQFMLSGTKDAKSGPFDVFRLRDKDSLYFMAMAGNCYVKQDAKCNDFCTYNMDKESWNSGGRRRRDVSELEEPETVISARLNIILTGNEGNDVILPADNAAQRNEEAKRQAAENETLLGAVIALGTLFVVGLAVAMAIFYRLTKVNRKA